MAGRFWAVLGGTGTNELTRRKTFIAITFIIFLKELGLLTQRPAKQTDREPASKPSINNSQLSNQPTDLQTHQFTHQQTKPTCLINT